MKSHRIIPAIALVLSLVTIIGPDSSAQERLPDGSVVDFVVPAGTAISSPGSTVIFTGPADGTAVGLGTCGIGGPLQSTVVITPGHGRPFSVNVIVLHVDGAANTAVPPGTRLGSIGSLGICGTSGDYDKWRGVVE